jgi:hypothetical protein
MSDCALLDHIAVTGRRFLAEHKKPPTTLALGRWDARELARVMQRLGVTPDARKFLHAARDGLTATCFGDFPVQVRLDGRIGRMPGALWWHP